MMRQALRNKVSRSMSVVGTKPQGMIPTDMLNQLGLGIADRNQQGLAMGLDPQSMSPQETEWLTAYARRIAGDF